jgi:tetratricopeptide (TPR) repeat protein
VHGSSYVASVVVPQQLPAAPASFAGRQRELQSLTGWLDVGITSGESLIVVIGGTAGAGKTALALRWAHQAGQRFPDGHLYANLRGFDGSRAPVTPAEVIGGFLESLGVAADRIPPRLEARAGLYRSMLAGRRMLIVLDNARHETQVRPLLPGSPGCLVLVTSRSELAGLVASEGARPLILDVLTEREARQMLASRLGGRVEAEADAVTEVIALCARLPLALAIAAARAAIRPAFPLASLAAGLRGTRDRLDELDAGDRAASIRAVFSWSYRLQSEPAARMFRLLGAHPGPDISHAAAASLADVPGHSAHAALGELTRANLIREQAPGRFMLHDLLRAYAADLGDEDERCLALRRVLDYYLHTANAATRLAYPASAKITVNAPSPGSVPGHLTGPGQALAWLRSEHQVLVSATAAAAEAGFDTHAGQLPAVLSEHFARRGHYQDLAQSQRIALACATRLGDPAAQALARRSLADALTQLGCGEDARRHLQEAHELYGLLHDQAGQAACQCGMSRLAEARGDHGGSLSHARHALRLYRAVGDLAGQAAAMNGVGWDYALLGDSQRALGYCAKALELHRETGNRFGEAMTLDSIGYCHHRAGRHTEAIAHYQQALSAYADAGDRYLRAHTLIRLGESHRAREHHEAGRDLWRQALTILEDLHHPDAESLRARLAGVTVAAAHPPN